QPLQKVEVVLADGTHTQWLRMHDALVREELNVKAVDYTTDGRDYVQYNVQPNFKRLGPRVGRLMPQVKQALAAADGGQLLTQLQSAGKITLRVDGQAVELDDQDIQVRL